MTREPYQNPWLNIDGQIQKLMSRGLRIDDIGVVKQRLLYVNYYRFAGYGLKFQHLDDNNERMFNAGVSFDDVWGLCVFDKDLRDVFSEALELVEISLRSSIAYVFGKAHGAFGHVDPSNFDVNFNREQSSRASRSRRIVPFRDWRSTILSETRRSSEIFVKHFEQRYTQYPDLPIWVVGEICSFGTLSRMYSNMLNVDQGKVAAEYGLQYLVLQSWMHALTYIRNVCAHHARLWDKVLQIAPELPQRKNWQKLSGCERSVFTSTLMLNWMLSHDSIDKQVHATWKRKLEMLMQEFDEKYPNLLSFTGFPKDWKKNPLWWQY